MPKTSKKESVLHDWVHELTFQQQALLLTAMRGPDGIEKHTVAKIMIRYLRGVVIKPAGDWHGENNNDFMWGEYTMKNVSILGHYGPLNLFSSYTKEFWHNHDHYPHHFIMHLLHCAEVVGYKHSDESMRKAWSNFYLSGCHSFHMKPESEDEMDERLNDFGCGYTEPYSVTVEN